MKLYESNSVCWRTQSHLNGDSKKLQSHFLDVCSRMNILDRMVTESRVDRFCILLIHIH